MLGRPVLSTDENVALRFAHGALSLTELEQDAETAGLDYYTQIMQTTGDPEIRVLAKEFALEEAQHVVELQRWMQLHLSGSKLPTDVWAALPGT